LNPKKKKQRAERQERERRRREQVFAKRKLSTALPVAGPLTIRTEYGPGLLSSGGPLISASWKVVQPLASVLAAEGKPVPPPVRGVLLLDTGATSTCISQKAAESLALKPIRMATGYGSAGETLHPVYLAELEIAVAQPDGMVTSLTLAGPAMGIKDLDRHASHLGIKFAGRPVEVIGLLGRDILRCTRFRYDGISGVLVIDFDLLAIQSVFRPSEALGSVPPHSAASEEK
jgi:predicted aspartyl protease